MFPMVSIPVYINYISPGQWYAETTQYGLYIYQPSESFALRLLNENKTITNTLDYLVNNRDFFDDIDIELFDWIVAVAKIDPLTGEFLDFPVEKCSFYVDDMGIDLQANQYTGEISITVDSMLLVSHITELVTWNEEITWIQNGRLLTFLTDELLYLGGTDRIINPQHRSNEIIIPYEISSFCKVTIDGLTYLYNMEPSKDRIWVLLPQRTFEGQVENIMYKYPELRYFKKEKVFEKVSEVLSVNYNLHLV